MKLFKKGEIAKCHMTYAKNIPSEWTGEIALIMESSENDNPFIEDDSILKELNISQKKYNMNVARNIRYKAMIGRRIVFMNHLCFVEEDDFVDWKVATSETFLNYL